MNLETISVEVLAADYKARMISSNEIYSVFVQDRNLKPEISAKELLQIVERVSPSLLKRTISSTALQTDTVLFFLTEYGGSGSTPRSFIKELRELDKQNVAS